MKRELLQDIRASIGYADHLDTTIPGPPVEPSTVEAAIKKIGQLSAYMTDIISRFAGCAPLRVPYHMGQGNEAVLALLIASLAVNPDAVGFDITIPLPDSVWVIWDFPPEGEGQEVIVTISANPQRVTAATVTLIDPGGHAFEPQAMEPGEEGNTYHYVIIGSLTSGIWTLEFNVTWDGDSDTPKTLTQTITVEVRS